MKLKRLSLLLLLVQLHAFGQTGTVTGTIKDKFDKSPLIGASVFVLHTDSSLYKGAAADLNGAFKIEDVQFGKYILKISFLGYNDHYQLLLHNKGVDEIGEVELNSNAQHLKDVVIEDKAPTAIQKDDTTQYNANSYKTNPDATAEDLITKMSGITSQDGKIQAHGEDVKKVLVDGKPFFGDDPNAALKTLPADVIDKIQVFDQQTDQSKFTGVGDGNTTKTINIITKPGMKNGTFGKVYGGYGYEDVYKAGGNINFFKGKQRLTVLAQSNNISEQNFSADDLAGVMSGSGGGGGHGGHKGGYSGGGGNYGNNASSNFLVDTKNGLATTHAFGLNFVDNWGGKTDVSASYFFNYSDTKADQNTNRQYILPSDSGRIYKELSLNNSLNMNHRFNAKLEFKPDTTNAFTFTPRISIQQNDGSSNLSAHTAVNDTIINSSSTVYAPKILASNSSGDLLYMHKFAKRGRSLSIDLNGSYASNSGKNELSATNNFYTDTLTTLSTLQQKSTLDKTTTSYGGNISYTEPAGSKAVVQFSYSNGFTNTQNSKTTFNFNTTSNDYSTQDSSLSNVFKSQYNTHKAGVGYRFNSEKLNMMASVNYQLSTLQSNQDFPFQFSLNKTYQNILPTLMMKYNFNSKKSLRLVYRSQTNQPQIEQLQNVLDNSNPLQLTMGNEQLQPTYDNMVFMRYSSTNTDKASSFFFMLAGILTNNYIGNSTYTANADTTIQGVQLSNGSQLTIPVNIDGYYTLRSFITYGIPVSWLRCNMNLNANASYTQTPGLLNNIRNLSDAQNYGAGISFSSNISKNIDFAISTNTGYSFSVNSVNTSLNTSSLSQNSKFKLNLIFLNSIVFATDLTHQYTTGLSDGYNQNTLLWNAGIGYKFLKDKKAELRFSVNDILGQNTAISRNNTETYVEDVQTTVLQRFYMLTFTYNIKKFGQKAKAADAAPERNGAMPQR